MSHKISLICDFNLIIINNKSQSKIPRNVQEINIKRIEKVAIKKGIAQEFKIDETQHAVSQHCAIRIYLLQVFMVELTRGWNSRLGFSLISEGDRTVISVVHRDSVAAKDGRLKQGDVLIMVSNGVQVFYVNIPTVPRTIKYEYEDNLDKCRIFPLLVFIYLPLLI